MGGVWGGGGAGEWAEVSMAAAAVTRLDVAMEKLTAAAAVTDVAIDATEMTELRDQRTVWGLRLVAAQVKGIMGLQSAVLDEEISDGAASQSALAAEVARLEKLTVGPCRLNPG